MSKNFCLKVNGKKIFINRFVKEVFFNVIKGLIDTLDKIPENKKKIEIIIEEEEDK